MNEQQAYCRNLVAIARADGTVAEKELAVMRQLILEIGGRPEVLQTSLNHLGELSPSWDAFARPSAKIRCFEDMVAVAIADRVLADAERKILAQAAMDIGLGEAFANAIIRHVANEGR